MVYFTKRKVGKDMDAILDPELESEEEEQEKKSIFIRFLNCLTTGGKSGVELGLDIIPGVLVICTIVMMLTYGAGANGYTGDAYQGIALLPAIAGKAQSVISFIFGFSNPECVSVPIIAIGSSGAALSMVSNLLREGYANLQDLAVFNAICMCWSGYLSTHVAMMASLHRTQYTGQAILSHTIGGLVAGFTARWYYVFFSAIL
jgi:hypothetical protein